MTEQKLKVGISLRVVEEQKYPEKRDALSHEWIPFLEGLDIIPIFIPNTLLEVKSFLINVGINGIILSGGDNIGDHPERDKTEKAILEFGIEKKIPIFGVCRGMQVINQYFGGKVEPTLDSSHVGKPHEVIISNENFLQIFNSSLVEVNSFHHNIISKINLGKDLVPFAVSPDQTIEGFVHEKLPIEGVMWHPERAPNDFNRIILKKMFQDGMFWKIQK